MPHVYILCCADNRYYIGSTTDLNQRLKDRQKGKCKFTKSRSPVQLIYQEKFPTLSEARKREYALKKFKSRTRLEKMIKSAPASSGAFV